MPGTPLPEQTVVSWRVILPQTLLLINLTLGTYLKILTQALVPAAPIFK